MNRNLFEILLSIQLIFNPQEVVCNPKDKDLCNIASEFFNIPIINKPTTEKRVLVIGIPMKLNCEYLCLKKNIFIDT